MISKSQFLLCCLVLASVLHEALLSQVVQCQANDAGCKRCQSSCSAINPSHLPECCEAFNACCDYYLNACKSCDSISLTDKFFPEYCCASFTSCCDKVSTIKVSATTKRPLRKEEVVVAVQAPRPSSLSTGGVIEASTPLQPQSPPIPTLPPQTKETPPSQGQPHPFSSLSPSRTPNKPGLVTSFIDKTFKLPSPIHQTTSQGNNSRRRGGDTSVSGTSTVVGGSPGTQRGATRTRGGNNQRPASNTRPNPQRTRISSRGRVSSRGRIN